jgi:Caspase domain
LPENEAGSDFKRNGKARAVLIGINEYEDLENIPKLYGAVNDAKHLSEKLQKYGDFAINEDDVLTNDQATSRNIRQKLNDLFWKTHENYELMIFYFSGHGFKDSYYGHEYIAPYDLRTDSPLVEGIKIGYINNLIASYYEKTKQSVILILDCCHSGFSLKKGEEEQEKKAFKDPLTLEELSPVGWVTFSSSESFQKSLESQSSEFGYDYPHHHGLFTSWILQGLDGAAETADNGVVTIGALQTFLESNKRAMGQMTPVTVLQGAPLKIELAMAAQKHNSYFDAFKKDCEEELMPLNKGPLAGYVSMFALNNIIAKKRAFNPLTKSDKDYVATIESRIKDNLIKNSTVILGWAGNNEKYICDRFKKRAKDDNLLPDALIRDENQKIHNRLTDLAICFDYKAYPEGVDENTRKILDSIFNYAADGVNFANAEKDKSIDGKLSGFVLNIFNLWCRDSTVDNTTKRAPPPPPSE